MPSSGRPLEGAIVDATTIKTQLAATTTCHLFKEGWAPGPGNVAADFALHEADYEGYAAATIATWSSVYIYGGGAGAFISGVDQYFPWVAGAGTPSNTIAGFWLQDAAGMVREYVVFDTPVVISGAGQVVPVTPTILFPAS